jgi:hypothetical protein
VIYDNNLKEIIKIVIIITIAYSLIGYCMALGIECGNTAYCSKN